MWGLVAGRAPLGVRLGNEGRIQQLDVGGGGGDPDREAVGVAGMGRVGRVAFREDDFGAEQWSGRLLAL